MSLNKTVGTKVVFALLVVQEQQPVSHVGLINQSKQRGTRVATSWPITVAQRGENGETKWPFLLWHALLESSTACCTQRAGIYARS